MTLDNMLEILILHPEYENACPKEYDHPFRLVLFIVLISTVFTILTLHPVRIANTVLTSTVNSTTLQVGQSATKCTDF
jgi:hypothetical protein